MNIDVLMSSGDVDNWADVADAIEGDAGQLVVVADIESDEVPGSMKTLTVREEIEQQVTPSGDPAQLGQVMVPVTATKSTTFEVVAVYAPGMWMKVEFNQ